MATKEKARWITLHGTTEKGSHGIHVQVQDGKIVKGPRHLVGQKLSELHKKKPRSETEKLPSKKPAPKSTPKAEEKKETPKDEKPKAGQINTPRELYDAHKKRAELKKGIDAHKKEADNKRLPEAHRLMHDAYGKLKQKQHDALHEAIGDAEGRGVKPDNGYPVVTRDPSLHDFAKGGKVRLFDVEHDGAKYQVHAVPNRPHNVFRGEYNLQIHKPGQDPQHLQRIEGDFNLRGLQNHVATQLHKDAKVEPVPKLGQHLVAPPPEGQRPEAAPAAQAPAGDAPAAPEPAPGKAATTPHPPAPQKVDNRAAAQPPKEPTPKAEAAPEPAPAPAAPPAPEPAPAAAPPNSVEGGYERQRGNGQMRRINVNKNPEGGYQIANDSGLQMDVADTAELKNKLHRQLNYKKIEHKAGDRVNFFHPDGRPGGGVVDAVGPDGKLQIGGHAIDPKHAWAPGRKSPPAPAGVAAAPAAPAAPVDAKAQALQNSQWIHPDGTPKFTVPDRQAAFNKMVDKMNHHEVGALFQKYHPPGLVGIDAGEAYKKLHQKMKAAAAAGPKPPAPPAVKNPDRREPEDHTPAHRAPVYHALENQPIMEMKNLGGGCNVSKIAKLADGTQGVWKPQDGEHAALRKNVPHGTYFKREAAASAVADAIGYGDLVPVTTVRKDEKGKLGSIQHLATKAAVAHKASEPFDGAEDQARGAAFDYLIGHSDRHQKNWMVQDLKHNGPRKNWMAGPRAGGGPDGSNEKMILIDNGLAFPVDHNGAQAVGGRKDTYFNRGLWNRAIDKGHAVPHLDAAAWPHIEAGLQKIGLEPEAIAGTKARFDTLVKHAGQKFADLPAFWEPGKTMADIRHT